MKRLYSILLAAVLMVSLIACAAPAKEPEQTPPPPAPALPAPAAEEEAPPEPEPPPPDPLEELLSSLTLEEKIGQLFFVRCPAENAVEDIAAYHLGGYILFGRDTEGQTPQSLTATIDSFQRSASIPLLIGVDEEGGTVVRVSSNPALRSSRFRSPRKLYASGGMEALTAEVREKDALLKELGFNVNLAPVADVSSTPGDFIYDRAIGKNAAETTELVTAMVTVSAEDGMGSVLKHFPGYGSNVDTHTGIARDPRPMEVFETEDLIPFQAWAAGKGTTAILMSHNIVECMDPDLPASLSPEVHALLRQKLGFDGVVMTDDLAMKAVEAYAEDGSAALMALQAGNDLVLTSDYRTQIPLVIQAAEDGTLDQASIDAACMRVLRWKEALGLLDLPAQ